MGEEHFDEPAMVDSKGVLGSLLGITLDQVGRPVFCVSRKC